MMKNIFILISFVLLINLLAAQPKWKIAEGCVFDKLKSIKTGCNADITVIYETKIVEEKQLGDSLIKRTTIIETKHKFNESINKINQTLVSVEHEIVDTISKSKTNLIILNDTMNDILEFNINILSKDTNINRTTQTSTFSTIQTKPSRIKKRDSIILEEDPNQKMTGCLYLGVSYIPSFSYRQVLVRKEIFMDYDALDKRKYDESRLLTYANISGKIGWRMSKDHILYGEYGYLQQGFRTFRHSINWQNGFPIDSITEEKKPIKQKMNSHIIGIGYNYTPYDNEKYIPYISFTTDIGLYCTLGESNHLVETLNKNSLRINRIGTKIAAGISYAPHYCWNLKVMPTLVWDFSPIDRGELRTRLYNIGLTVEIGWNPLHFRNYGKQ